MDRRDRDMESRTLAAPVEGGVDPVAPSAVAARPGCPGALVPVSGSGGSSTVSGSSSSSLGATPTATTARRRTPGRWRRIPRATAPSPPPAGLSSELAPVVPVLPPGFTLPPAGSTEFPFLPGFRLASCTPPSAALPRESGEGEASGRWAPMGPVFVVGREGSKELEESRERCNRSLLEKADALENADEELCDTEEAKVAFRAFKVKFSNFYRELANAKPEDVVLKHEPPSDTQEEHLTAGDMEERLSGRMVCPQAQHFATLALAHYNSTNKTHKYEMATVLLSKCFSETDGRTFGHVNFTATTQDQSATHLPKRLFFAELMLITHLQTYEGVEPMCVLHVCTIDGSCFGGCHEMERDIKKPLKDNLDYERCHACSERIKHPRGDQFVGGHNSTKMPYFSMFV